jgi:cytochrome c oxidase cbb3-type subunit 4
MDFDLNTLRTIGTVLVFVAFIGICIWAYSAKRKKSFDEAADLPFADEKKDDIDDKQNETVDDQSSLDTKKPGNNR